MTRYVYLFDQAGVCTCRVQPHPDTDAAEIALLNSATNHLDTEQLVDVHLARLVNGQLVEVAPDAPVLTYQQRRFAAYPAVHDQLDALWHAMNAGELPRVAAFFDPIAAVKAAHPKE